MLFVSRRIYPDMYGIFDTDDGVEESVDLNQIDHYCCDYGLAIQGVEVAHSYVDMIQRVLPYQPESTLSQKQIKLKMLTGVDLKVCDGAITSIWWDNTPVDKPILIRLSDFAKSVADCIFVRDTNIGFHKVTLVLDDSISVYLRSFDIMEADDIYEGKEGIGVAIDVREVRDMNRLRTIYRSFIHGAYHDLSDSIIDHEKRKKRLLKEVVR